MYSVLGFGSSHAWRFAGLAGLWFSGCKIFVCFLISAFKLGSIMKYVSIFLKNSPFSLGFYINGLNVTIWKKKTMIMYTIFNITDYLSAAVLVSNQCTFSMICVSVQGSPNKRKPSFGKHFEIFPEYILFIKIYRYFYVRCERSR